MILTGKAKQDFLIWVMWQSNYTNNSNHLIISENSKRGEFLWYGNETDLLKESKFLNALIIEWLDSVCIYISINYVNFTNIGFENMVTNKHITIKFKEVNTRTEATEKAIEKANEIYNNLNF